MNRSIFLFLLAILVTGKSFAKTQSLVMDTRGALIGIYSLEYEQLLSEKVTLAVQGQICNYPQDNTKLLAYSLGVGKRKYILEKNFSGAYWGAYGTANYIKTEGATTTSFGAAGSIGYKQLLESGLVVDLGISLGIPFFTSIKEATSTETVNFGALGFGLTLGLGYAW